MVTTQIKAFHRKGQRAERLSSPGAALKQLTRLIPSGRSLLAYQTPPKLPPPPSPLPELHHLKRKARLTPAPAKAKSPASLGWGLLTNEGTPAMSKTVPTTANTICDESSDELPVEPTFSVDPQTFDWATLERPEPCRDFLELEYEEKVETFRFGQLRYSRSDSGTWRILEDDGSWRLVVVADKLTALEQLYRRAFGT